MPTYLSIIECGQADKTVTLNLTEFSRCLQADNQLVVEMVNYELIQPKGTHPNNWQFDACCLKRAKTIVSFYRELGVNLEGIGLALHLLDRVEELENRLKKFDLF